MTRSSLTMDRLLNQASFEALRAVELVWRAFEIPGIKASVEIGKAGVIISFAVGSLRNLGLEGPRKYGVLGHSEWNLCASIGRGRKYSSVEPTLADVYISHFEALGKCGRFGPSSFLVYDQVSRKSDFVFLPVEEECVVGRNVVAEKSKRIANHELCLVCFPMLWST